VEALEEHANGVAATMQESIDQLWSNQKVIQEGLEVTSWKIDQLLHVVMPDSYPAPPPLEVKGDSDEERSEEAEGTEAP